MDIEANQPTQPTNQTTTEQQNPLENIVNNENIENNENNENIENETQSKGEEELLQDTKKFVVEEEQKTVQQNYQLIS